MLKYMNCLLNKIKEYEKKVEKYDTFAKNPFLENNSKNPFKKDPSFYDRTYIWIE